MQNNEDLRKEENFFPLGRFFVLWISTTLLLSFLAMTVYASKVSDSSFAGMYLMIGPIMYGIPLGISVGIYCQGISLNQTNDLARANRLKNIGWILTAIIFVIALVWTT